MFSTVRPQRAGYVLNAPFFIFLRLLIPYEIVTCIWGLRTWTEGRFIIYAVCLASKSAVRYVKKKKELCMKS